MSRRFKKIQSQPKIPNPAICPKCNKIVTTPPKVDPLFKAFRKWKCEHCETVWGENYPKGRCSQFGIIRQSRCLKCGHALVARAKKQNCPYFTRMMHPPLKWLQKAWEKS